MKKVILFLFCLGILFFARFAMADVVISEVMYAPIQSDSYNEWIELNNTGSSAVDLTNLTVCGKAVASGYIKHSDASLNSDIGLSLPAGGFAVVTDGGSGTDAYANYNIDAAALALHIATASEICGGLTNSGKTISLAGPSTNSMTYSSSQGATGDGNSLQLVNSSWLSATPTPGAANQTSSSGGSGGGSGGVEANGTPPPIVPDTNQAPSATPTIKAKIVTKTIAFAGSGITMQGNITGISGENLRYGRFFWNFGDGDSLKAKSNDIFTHTYFYPGEYNVVLEYNQNAYGDTPDATDKITVKVYAPDIIISAVGDSKDFFVEITNNTPVDADISGWILSAGIKSFVFPKDSILPSKKKTTLSGKVTGFSVSDKDNLKILFPTGETVFDYNSVAPIISPTNKNSVPTIVATKEISKTTLPIEKAVTIDDSPKVPTNSLVATANQSDISDSSAGSPLWIWVVGLIVLLGVAAGATWFIRKGSTGAGADSSAGSDFKILDE